MSKSEHLQWLHDRIVNVYGESENVDFLIRFREIIKDIKDEEDIKHWIGRWKRLKPSKTRDMTLKIWSKGLKQNKDE